MENKTKAWAGLDKVTENAIAQIKAIAPLHTIEFVPISHSRLEFYVFYKTNEDLKTSTNEKRANLLNKLSSKSWRRSVEETKMASRSDLNLTHTKMFWRNSTEATKCVFAS